MGLRRRDGDGRPARPRAAFVCQPTTTLLPVRDSVTMVTHELASRLGEHADVVLCGAGGRRRSRAVEVGGVDYILVPTGPDLLVHRAALAVRRWRGRDEPRRPFFESRLFYLVFAVRVALQLRRRGCEIIHIQSFSHFVPVIRALNPRAKVVLHMHCEWLSQLDPHLIGPRLAKVDLVVACSDHVTGRVQQAFPVGVRCVTVHNGVSPMDETAVPAPSASPPAPSSASPRRLLFVSRVSPEKGLHVLLEAFRVIADVHPDVVLDIVGPEHTIPAGYIVDLTDDPHVEGLRAFYGDGLYGDALRRRIPAAIRDRVSFVGFVPPTEMAGHYRRSTLLVHPSLSDSFGMPVVEAMAAGLPVVASRTGGIPEIVEHGRTGLLVAANDPDALAVAVLTLLDDDDLAARMGRTGRLRAEASFSWDAAAANLWSEYERLMACPSGASRH